MSIRRREGEFMRLSSQERTQYATDNTLFWSLRDHPIYQSIAAIAHMASGSSTGLVMAVKDRGLRVVAQSGDPFVDSLVGPSFCSQVVEGFAPLVVEDALNDRRFAYNPVVVGAPYVRAYAGAPVIDCEGHALGTVCIVSSTPRSFSRSEVAMLENLADLTSCLLNFEDCALAVRRIASHTGTDIADITKAFAGQCQK